MKYQIWLGVLVVAIAAAGCSQPTNPTTAPPLSNTFESADALARTVLDRLEKRDRTALAALALSEAEFRAHVWPELPTSRPERNVPFEYAWGQLKQHSDSSLNNTVGRYGGQSLKLVRVSFAGDTTTYQSFQVMRENEIVAIDAGGREVTLHLFGSAMVQNGRYKVFSFVVDD